MWDLTEDANSIAWSRPSTTPGNQWLRSVTLPPSGFTNTEEEAVHLTKVEGRTVPRRGRTEAARRALWESRRLAELSNRRWPPDHRPEPGLVQGDSAEAMPLDRGQTPV